MILFETFSFFSSLSHDADDLFIEISVRFSEWISVSVPNKAA
jgi:hypothetical protein